MPSSVPAVKTGLKLFLSTTAGLRDTDGVTIRRADPEPREFAQQLVVLGSATTTQTQAGLGSRAETATLTCWVMVTRIGVGDTKAAEACDRAYELLDLIEAAIKADRTAAGSVPPPGRLDFTSSSLEEMPVDWDESPGRRAQLQFQLSWTSHISG
jgi:hypothetical protein